MEAKKNSKANVGRNSSLYFAIGLALMLFLTNYAINYKTYEKAETDVGMVEMEQEIEEDIPITQQQIKTPPPPPPPPPAPEVIEIVEDEEEVEETVIESTEATQDTEIVEVEQVFVEEVEEDIDVPFTVLEDKPVFPGCEKVKKSKQGDCFNEKMKKFIGKKFNTELAGELGLTGRQRITVTFKISKTGDIENIRSRAPHPRLQKEAERVIKLLPKMKPGKQRGKAVGVPYALPIVFQVQD